MSTSCACFKKRGKGLRPNAPCPAVGVSQGNSKGSAHESQVKRWLRFVETDFNELFPERSHHVFEGFRINNVIEVFRFLGHQTDGALRG